MNAITKTREPAVGAASSGSGSVHGGNSLSRKDFEKLAKFIQGYSGIKMPPNKLTMVEGRLRRRLKATGYPTFAQYCSYLFDQNGLEDEAVHLIDAVTTNKTEFFREPTHFDFLRDRGLSMLTTPERRTLKAWIAACSIGAEPYTLAMVIEEHLRECEHCEITLNTTRKTIQIYRSHEIYELPDDLRERLHQAILAKCRKC